jgi:hypothetical protein
MITRQEGEDIIEHMVPHTVTPGDKHPVTQVHHHITQKNLDWCGVSAERLQGLPGYDGPETWGNTAVHVFDLPLFKDYVNQLTLVPGTSAYVVDMPGRSKEHKI